MLDFETPTYITAKESQQMQSGVSPAQTPTQQVYHRANAQTTSTRKSVEPVVIPQVWMMGFFNI